MPQASDKLLLANLIDNFPLKFKFIPLHPNKTKFIPISHQQYKLKFQTPQKFPSNLKRETFQYPPIIVYQIQTIIVKYESEKCEINKQTKTVVFPIECC